MVEVTTACWLAGTAESGLTREECPCLCADKIFGSRFASALHSLLPEGQSLFSLEGTSYSCSLSTWGSQDPALANVQVLNF